MAKFRLYSEAAAYRFYVSDAMKMLNNNFTRHYGGYTIERRFYDTLHPEPKDERTGEQIAADVIKNAGLEVI